VNGPDAWRPQPARRRDDADDQTGRATEISSGDTQRLQEQFGDQGWQFGTVWASGASDPDKRRLYATRGGVLLTAWTAEELVRNIQQEG
jgi:hypothetical protein